jgi:hypothetical protein
VIALLLLTVVTGGVALSRRYFASFLRVPVEVSRESLPAITDRSGVEAEWAVVEGDYAASN